MAWGAEAVAVAREEPEPDEMTPELLAEIRARLRPPGPDFAR
jgi:hypothetical protein